MTTSTGPTTLGDAFARALVYAHEAHLGQLRKGTGTPYVSHLLGVASLVLEGGGDEGQAIAALLHDTAEDRPLPEVAGRTGGQARLEDIADRFGQRVATMVEHLSDTLDKTHESRSWTQRKRDYLEGLAGADPSAPHLLVSVADKLHNCRSIVRDLRATDDPNEVWSRFSGRRTGTAWYYDALRRTYRSLGLSTVLVDLLDREVDVLLELAGVAGDTPLEVPVRPDR